MKQSELRRANAEAAELAGSDDEGFMSVDE